MIGEILARLIASIPVHAIRVRDVRSGVDNDRIARDVLYHARVAAEEITAPEYPLDLRAVHDYLRNSVQYLEDTDPDAQRLRMPWTTVLEGRADCKSFAIFIAALAKAAGHAVELCYIDQGSGGWDHVYPIVDGTPVDPLCEFGEVPPVVERVCIERV